jgi:hypothetical protein
MCFRDRVAKDLEEFKGFGATPQTILDLPNGRVDKECGICYCLEFRGKVPSNRCENKTCIQVYHAVSQRGMRPMLFPNFSLS